MSVQMNVPVTCPYCETTYQLQPEIIGQQIRCPNTLCQEIFLAQQVGADASATPTDQEPANQDLTSSAPVEQKHTESQQTPPAEAPIPKQEESPPAPEPPAPIDEPKPPFAPPKRTEPIDLPAGVWKEPPVRSSTETTEDITAAGNASAADQEKTVPVEMAPGSWAPPPVRGQSAAEATDVDGGSAGQVDAPPIRESEGVEPDTESAPADILGDELMMQPKVPIRAVGIIVGLLLLVTLLVAGGFWLFQDRMADVESQRQQAAVELYEKYQFAEAAAQFGKLAEDYTESKHHSHYEFLGGFSRVRAPIYTTHSDVSELGLAVKGLQEFLRKNQQHPSLPKHQGDVWETLLRAANNLGLWAEQKKDRQLLAQARQLLESSLDYKAPDKISSAEKIEEIKTQFVNIEGQLKKGKLRLQLLAKLNDLVKNPTGNPVKSSQFFVQTFIKDEPALAHDPEIIGLLKRMPALHRAAVRYTAKLQKPLPLTNAKVGENIYFAASSTSDRDMALHHTRPIPVCADGVLYVVDAQRGNVLWTRRVGLDSDAPPLWLPTAPTKAERFLVLSADELSLSAVVAHSGKKLWEQRLPSACMGQPVLLGRRVFVPCRNGDITEIDIYSGRQLGFYHVDQNLTGWGLSDAATNRIFVCADSYCIYVLDVEQRKCVDIVYTKHHGGSIQGKPIALSNFERGSTQQTGTGLNWLLYAQVKDMDHVEIRAAAMGNEDDANRKIVTLKTLSGWTWFAPWDNGVDLSFVSDGGEFVVLGRRAEMTGVRKPLFTRFEQFVVNPRNSKRPARSQVIYAKRNFYWVHVHDHLHQVQSAFFRDSGPKLLPPWMKPIYLGSPIQPSTVRENGNGGDVIFTVTQQPSGAAVLTAIAARDGKILRQTRLGFHSLPRLLSVGNRVVCTDRRGNVLLFDPNKGATNGKWLASDQFAAARFNSNRRPQHQLFDPESKKLFLLAVSPRAKTKNLEVRSIHFGKPAGQSNKSFRLKAELRGTPAVTNGAIIAPLANGILARIPLANGAAEDGPNWRATRADIDSLGHVVALGGDRVLFTDGSTGIKLLTWPRETSWEINTLFNMPRRISRPPILLNSKDGAASQVVLADADNTVALIRIDPPKRLRAWKMTGRITAGPFASDGNIGCIIDHQHLVWLSPEKEKLRWKYEAKAKITGIPQVIGGRVVVADQSGQIAWLDPQTGKTQGEPFVLPSTTTPTASPVAWGPARIFVPLSDGTAVLAPSPK